MIEERYRAIEGRVARELAVGGRTFSSRVEDLSQLDHSASAWSRWWRSFLRGARPAFDGPTGGELSIVDLFSGCGGLTLGAKEAACAVGLELRVRLAVDVDERALEVYATNFAPERTLAADVRSLVDFGITGWAAFTRFARPPVVVHRALKELQGAVDLVVAGPPCEGHSNLNNRTRRADPRNLLFLDAVAAGVALGANAIVVENVPQILRDRFETAEMAAALLRSSGYQVTQGVLAADGLGWAQARRRFFLVASRSSVLDLEDVARSLAREPTTLRWAIEDLADLADDPVMDSTPSLSPDNRRRIDYLFEHGLFDLPNDMRPACHRDGHTYPSVYGRLRWDEPAQTITTGFRSPGRGRFIHPSRMRPLSPREAARLQGFPDWFRFRLDGGEAPSKASLSRWIGDAVPSILGYGAVLSVLPGMLASTLLRRRRVLPGLSGGVGAPETV